MLQPDDCWGLENHKDFLLIPVKNSKTVKGSLQTFGFIVLDADLSLLSQDTSEYKGLSKALEVAKQWVDLHLARMEAL